MGRAGFEPASHPAGGLQPLGVTNHHSDPGGEGWRPRRLHAICSVVNEHASTRRHSTWQGCSESNAVDAGFGNPPATSASPLGPQDLRPTPRISLRGWIALPEVAGGVAKAAITQIRLLKLPDPAQARRSTQRGYASEFSCDGLLCHTSTVGTQVHAVQQSLKAPLASGRSRQGRRGRTRCPRA